MTAVLGPFPGFYFITDAGLSRNGMLRDLELALDGGVAVVQYRDKDGAGPNAATAVQMRDLCRRHGVPFVVNDDVELALAVEADGVHVGQGDCPAAEVRGRLGPRAILGVSIASLEELTQAENARATYVAASPVFGTPTKPDAGTGIGLEGVRRLRAATRLPLAVIGGINATNVRAMVEAGADLVCAISASLAGGTVDTNVRTLRGLMGQGSRIAV